jgi:predicted restriction endonuclease
MEPKVRTAIEEQKEQDRKDKINFSRRVKKKYGDRCEFCGATEHIYSHHVIPRQYKDKGYPPVDDLSNGIVLCGIHHPIADKLSGTHDNSRKSFSEYTGPRTRDELLERLKGM